MAASIAVEVETGTITSVRIRHNGYYAGDFVSTRPTNLSTPRQPRHGVRVSSTMRAARS